MKRKTTRPAKAKPQRTGSTGSAVKATLDAYPSAPRRQLLALRKLIHDTARKTEGVGPLEEALKWGQISFLTTESKSGSTIRIDRVKDGDNQVAVFFRQLVQGGSEDFLDSLLLLCGHVVHSATPPIRAPARVVRDKNWSHSVKRNFGEKWLKNFARAGALAVSLGSGFAKRPPWHASLLESAWSNRIR